MIYHSQNLIVTCGEFLSENVIVCVAFYQFDRSFQFFILKQLPDAATARASQEHPLSATFTRTPVPVVRGCLEQRVGQVNPQPVVFGHRRPSLVASDR
jgi:hypothetical protein